MEKIKKLIIFINKRFFIFFLIGIIFSHASFNLFIFMDGAQEKYFTYPESTYKKLEDYAKNLVSQQNNIQNFRNSEMQVSAESENGTLVTITIICNSNDYKITRDNNSRTSQILTYEVAFLLIAMFFTFVFMSCVYVSLWIIYFSIVLFKKIQAKTQKNK